MRARDECSARRVAAVGDHKRALRTVSGKTMRGEHACSAWQMKTDPAKREYFACKELPRQTDRGIEWREEDAGIRIGVE